MVIIARARLRLRHSGGRLDSEANLKSIKPVQVAHDGLKRIQELQCTLNISTDNIKYLNKVILSNCEWQTAIKCYHLYHMNRWIWSSIRKL